MFEKAMEPNPTAVELYHAAALYYLQKVPVHFIYCVWCAK